MGPPGFPGLDGFKGIRGDNGTINIGDDGEKGTWIDLFQSTHGKKIFKNNHNVFLCSFHQYCTV